MAFAFLLIFVGVVFFLKNIGAVSWEWSQIWPLFVIGIGLYLAVAVHRASEWGNRMWKKISKLFK